MSNLVKNCLLVFTGAFHSNGGIAAVNRLMIYSLEEAGYKIDLHVLNEKSYCKTNSQQNNICVTNHYYSGDKFLFTTNVWNSVFKNKYDLVIVDHINLASILAPLSRIRKCRYLVWIFGIEIFPPKPDYEGALGYRNAWKRLAISEFTRSHIINKFPSFPVNLCELALDPIKHASELAPDPLISHAEIMLRAIDGSDHLLGQEVLLHVARMESGERYKGQDSLLQSFVTVNDQYPQTQLVLCGAGSDLERIRGIARNLPSSLHGRIFIPGYVEDILLKQLYQNCFLFAMPSTNEGFGIVFLEAMSYAKPCLGGNTDATPYIVKDGIHGVLVDNPKSPNEVALKICSLLQNKEKAISMGRAGYQLVRSKYLFRHFNSRFLSHIS